jgi:hypothetical protein
MYVNMSKTCHGAAFETTWTLNHLVKETKAIALESCPQIAADRRAFGDDVLAAFTTQIHRNGQRRKACSMPQPRRTRDTLLAVRAALSRCAIKKSAIHLA